MAIQDEKLSISTLTGGERQGAGAFEELMRAVKSHLSEEYSSGRITGDNYTNAYISALNTTMNTAAQFTLQAELTNQQIRLLDEQIAAGKLQVELVQEQIDKIKADTVFVTKQTLKLDSDIDLVDAQVLTQGKQLDVLDEQILNLTKELQVKDAQISYQDAQEDMVIQQTANELTRNSQIISQTNKIDAEEAILLQRAISEEAQVKDTVGGVAVGGIIGAQKTLYLNQADGYIRDAEQKAAKIMNDTLITRISTDYDQAIPADAGQSDEDVKSVIDILKAGITT